ncbi:MAG: SpoVA/SpoVAEb family sporulation membrane protein [Firmicutes bacterium]|nr:SpoVA/SpoVAEb family sporulation membrane protein [Bacillota bacterium]
MDPKTKAEQKKYQELVKGHSKKTPILKHVVLAFLIGGSICLIGQIALNYFSTVERTQGEAAATTLAFMIFLGAMATGFGVYDILGEIGGAGAAIPITGFANTVVASAMEFRREGFLLGMAAKMFVIAGPVLVYGILAGFLVTLIKASLLGLFP